MHIRVFGEHTKGKASKSRGGSYWHWYVCNFKFAISLNVLGFSGHGNTVGPCVSLWRFEESCQSGDSESERCQRGAFLADGPRGASLNKLVLPQSFPGPSPPRPPQAVC